MKIDIPIFMSFVYFFLSMNLYGWGILSNRAFISFSVALSIFYLFSYVFSLVGKPKWEFKYKLFLLSLFIFLSVFVTSIHFMLERNKTVPYLFVNDSALQVEIAGRYLLLGLNPYVENYVNTELAKWKYVYHIGWETLTVNPALYQNVIPPFLIVLSALQFRVFSQLFQWYDIRVIYLLAYLLVLTLGIIKFKRRGNILLFLLLVGLNPLFINSMIQGTNDVVVLSFLLWSSLFIEKRKYILSGILVGLALATKQTAWFAFPFLLFYVWQKEKKESFFCFFIPSVIVSLLFYVPFAIWNFSAIFGSLVLFAGHGSVGQGPIHPVEGYGFSMMLHSFGILKSLQDIYPFWILQGFFGLLTLFLLLYLQRKSMSMSSMFYSYAVFTSVMWFFNRYFLISHLGYLLVLVGVSYTWSLLEQGSSEDGKKVLSKK